MIYFGKDISFISYGTSTITKVFHGANLVWQKVKDILVKWWVNEKAWINEQPWVQ